MNESMLTLQADLIEAECRVIDVNIWATETNNMPETARQLRISLDILRASAKIIRQCANDEVEK